MLMDEKTQNLQKTAMGLAGDTSAMKLSRFAPTPPRDGKTPVPTRFPLWLNAALPFCCIALAVLLLGFTTQNWIIAGITGAAAFISLSAFFGYAAFQRIRGHQSLQRDLLIAAVEAKTKPVAITDLSGALVCANSAYGRLLSGFPSPSSLPSEDEDREQLQEAARSARICGRGTAQINRRYKDALQPLDVTVRRSRQIENYLIWDVEGAGEEARLQKFIDLCDTGLSAWSTQMGKAILLWDGNGKIRYASELMLEWLGHPAQPLTSYRQEDIFRQNGDGYQLLGTDEAEKPEYSAQIFDLANQADGTTSGTVAFFELGLRKQTIDVGQSDLPQKVFNDAPVGMVVIDSDGDILRHNPMLRRFASNAEGELPDNLFAMLTVEDQPKLREFLDGPAPSDPNATLEVRFAQDEEAVALIRVSKLADTQDETLVFLSDATEQKSLERQFAQAQKMQAVGQLAGGIAHDFNNILTAIIGFCDLLLVRHGAGDPSFADIMQVKQNANRAANLVRQLLAFSRQQTLMPKVLAITDILAELSNLIRRLIGENISLKIVHGRDLETIKVDQGQMEQVIVNLAVNARDAMPNGGELTITTAMHSHAEVAKMGHDFMPADDYISLSVEDTGHGIEKQHLNKIFEPFFTTKETGKGTGLGLSTVYGIIKQTGGFVFADSEPGKGAKFTIYLPVHRATAEEEAAKLKESAKEETPEVTDLWGKGTILLVEDEDAVRTFATRALMKKGYNVLEAASGHDALEILEQEEKIDLLISDVVMPNMDGPTLVKQVRDDRPNLNVIFISGYAQDGFGEAEGFDNIEFLPKPFSLSQLAEKVKEVMPTPEHESEMTTDV